MLRRCFFFLLFWASLAAEAQAQDPFNFLTSGSYTTTSGFNLPYRLFVPTNYDPNQTYPLVMYLHGGGGRGTDNVTQLTNESSILNWTDAWVQSSHPSFLLMPQAPESVAGGDPRGEYWVNNFGAFDTYDLGSTPQSTSLNAAVQLVQSLEGQFSIDPNRLYLTGWSSGGEGTWDTLMRQPGVFAAGIPIAGMGDPTQADKLVNTPIWAFQGALDTAMPPSAGEKMTDAVLAAGGNPLFSMLANGTHYIASDVYTDPGVVDWLFAQSLPQASPTPTPPPVIVPPVVTLPSPAPTPVPPPVSPPTGQPIGPAHLPEPGTAALALAGLVGLWAIRKTTRRSSRRGDAASR